ncbi:hypothetical protein A5654_24915 [Mycolicibacterium fortuitum]|nr:hypothetical protein A5654_24915 [Mycolicibacterium fortuitum]
MTVFFRECVWNGAPGTIYRLTATPEGSTRVDSAFTATTSFFSGTASGNVAVAVVVGQQILQGKGFVRSAVSISAASRLSIHRLTRSLCMQAISKMRARISLRHNEFSRR